MTRVRVKDVPRVVGYLLLVLPSLYCSKESSTSQPIATYIVVAFTGAMGSFCFFYDYEYRERYVIAATTSWATSSCLLLVTFHHLLDSDNVIFIFLAVFASFFGGIVTFCLLRTLKDHQSLPIPSLETDDYTVPKVLGSYGWNLYGFSILFFIFDRGSKDHTLSDAFYFCALAGIAVTSALLVSRGNPSGCLKLTAAMPISSLGTMGLASDQLKKDNDLTFMVFLLGVLGAIPGVGVYVLLRRYCVTSIHVRDLPPEQPSITNRGAYQGVDANEQQVLESQQSESPPEATDAIELT